jgi:hypothetical protein
LLTAGTTRRSPDAAVTAARHAFTARARPPGIEHCEERPVAAPPRAHGRPLDDEPAEPIPERHFLRTICTLVADELRRGLQLVVQVRRYT